ncbi:MAG TPA: sulfotransferase [Anaerolineae bacterium]|nr:sulfotransferase [Anaerolineae bacterium]
MRPDYVFIVGCNRTGTSLLRQILNQSPEMCLAPETHFLRRLSLVGADRILGKFGDLHAEQNVQRLVDFIYANHRALKISLWQWLKRNVARETFAAQVLATDRSERALFQVLMRVYCERMKPELTEPILGEKTPTHLYYVPTLMEWFPQAKVIHTIRDPRAIMVSKLKKVNRATSRDGFTKRMGAVPSHLMSPFADAIEMIHTGAAWMDAAHLDEQYTRRYPNQYRLLRFEDLVAKPEQQITALCKFLEIEFKPSMVQEIHVVSSSFEKTHRGEGGIDRRSLERWKEHSHPLVNKSLEIFGRSELERFGYLQRAN